VNAAPQVAQDQPVPIRQRAEFHCRQTVGGGGGT
jgi:hypothetical protein